MKFRMQWEQEEVTLDFESESGTPVDLLEALGERGRWMLLGVLTINYAEEVEQMIKLTWENPVRRRRVIGP